MSLLLLLLLLLALPILFVVALLQAIGRASRREAAGRADELAAMRQLLADVERMEKRVEALETILADVPSQTTGRSSER